MSDLTLQRTEDRADADWESFLDGDTDGTLFHRLSFLAYHPPDRFRTHHLIARRGEHVVGVIPLAEGSGDASGGLVSPYGGSFGGWAADASLELADHLALLDGLMDYARGGGFDHLWIASRPAPYRGHGEGAEGALAQRGGRVVRREITQIASITGEESDVMARLGGTARRGARKAERLGTAVRLSGSRAGDAADGGGADLEAFHVLLTDDRARLGTTPTHTLSDLQYLTGDRPQDYRLLLAENEGELVGGILLFRASETVAASFYTARADTPRAERCMNLLMEHSLLASRDWGCAALDFGTSSIGGALNEGLSHFKERFGGRSYLRETWRLAVEAETAPR